MKRITVVVSIIFSLMLLTACGGDSHDETPTTRFSMADLTGTWEINSLDSPGPFWERGTITVNSAGSVSGTVTAADGSTDQASGTLSITSDGIITTPDNASQRCAMDSGKTIVSCTATDNGGAVSRLTILVKKASSYSMADVAGRWEINNLDSPGPSWDRGPVTINSSGSLSGTITEWDGSSFPLSLTVGITSDGIVTTGVPTQRCVMDSDKTIVVCTQTNDDGGSGMLILSKKGASYSLADLTGAWEVNNLASPGPGWARGAVTFSSSGSSSGTITTKDGATEQASGTFSITSDGIITQTGVGSFRCVMDSDKTVITCTSTDEGTTTNLLILTKKQ